jgi:ketosteroid isomerase-like protein
VSEQNVEIVRRAYAALNERDFDSLLKLSDPDFVFDLSRSIGPQKGVYRGPEEFRSYWSDFLDAFEVYEATPVEVDVGPHGHIVVRFHVRAKGKGSGLVWENEPDATSVFEVRDGRILSNTLYQRHTEALKAAGLED